MSVSTHGALIHSDLPDSTWTAPDSGERGDVPGWVLVTLMTVGLVLAIWAVAGPALTNLFSTAIERISSFS
ncbi:MULTISPECIES: hypothetical protein [Actinotignum]|uniref:Uncharacterized protein n=1 Tax=Actinotignum timonense TaxID=1870995 RepID=A0AAW9HJK8_9ACTO|nr:MULTISPECIES: hypothetical protein [Actinotignum]MBS5748184.1 hypothetical protein [Actinotignum schaalii]MDE1558225.1 hypothetical protein [Actinotignum schaalii]MDE1663078.1 hypothetical protein [Actinotignum schaalii]MDK6374028.1 hypothetical protein [Actinotignum timonense]MDK6419451.1 hypothetical protein [Actinotignum timonense]